MALKFQVQTEWLNIITWKGFSGFYDQRKTKKYFIHFFFLSESLHKYICIYLIRPTNVSSHILFLSLISPYARGSRMRVFTDISFYLNLFWIFLMTAIRAAGFSPALSFVFELKKGYFPRIMTLKVVQLFLALKINMILSLREFLQWQIILYIDSGKEYIKQDVILLSLSFWLYP